MRKLARISLTAYFGIYTFKFKCLCYQSFQERTKDCTHVEAQGK